MIKNIPLPLYINIKNQLKQQILSDDYSIDERIPSENQLMTSFGVSRITVRKALKELHAEGLLWSIQGKGAFVSKPKVSQEIRSLQSLSEAIDSRLNRVSTKLLSAKKVTPSQAVQDNLNSKKVFEITRIRYLNKKPISLDTSYFPIEIGMKVLDTHETDDIFHTLENNLNVSLGQAHISMEARSAESKLAKILEVHIGKPIFWVTRLIKDMNDETIVCEYLAYRGDAYKYHLELNRS
jgi:GntR family transcriptional regulator|tara:strand:+ start:180 stop:893 length:714 start_codon:yes stop_codon:yes gene_type:complete